MSILLFLTQQLNRHKQGQCDYPLTEKGINDAELTGLAFSNVQWTRCFSSDLNRALETASIILRRSNTNPSPLITTTLARERAFGVRCVIF